MSSALAARALDVVVEGVVRFAQRPPSRSMSFTRSLPGRLVRAPGELDARSSSCCFSCVERVDARLRLAWSRSQPPRDARAASASGSSVALARRSEGVAQGLIDRPNILEHRALRAAPRELLRHPAGCAPAARPRSIPARLAASTFSLIPPTGRTLPRSVISPVIATRGSDRARRAAARRARSPSRRRRTARPSGRAPAGTWRCRSDFEKQLRHRAPSSRRVGAQPRTRRLGRFAHHVAERAGELELALARHARRLDEQDVAAGRRPRRGPPRRRADPTRSATSGSKLRGPEQTRADRSGARSRNEPRDASSATRRATLRRERADLALQVAHARLARVAADHARAARRREISSVDVVDAVLLALARQQEAARDLELVLLDVARAARSPPCGRAAPAGTGSIRFAVAMKSTCERSKGTSR